MDRRFGAAGSIGARLDALQREVGETAYLGIQNGAVAQYIISQRPGAADSLDVSSSQYRSLTCSAMGRALLSLKPTTEIRTWVRRCNAESPSDRFRVREAPFLELIAQVRADGFAATDGDVVPGFGAIAVPFSSPLHGAPLAVGVGGAIGPIRSKQRVIVAALTQFARSFAEADAALPDRSHQASS
jgi:DNA-binding IclR family transcriptional regulator